MATTPTDHMPAGTANRPQKNPVLRAMGPAFITAALVFGPGSVTASSSIGGRRPAPARHRREVAR